MNNEYAIPAASIGDVNIELASERFPEKAKEIIRLNELMEKGKDTEQEFMQLCVLLCEVGEESESEYLLRRNCDFYREKEKYLQLFGNAKIKKYEKSIEIFKEQFRVEISLKSELEFLESLYVSACTSNEPLMEIFGGEFQCQFSYSQKDIIEVDVENDKIEQWVLMEFSDENWTIKDGEYS